MSYSLKVWTHPASGERRVYVNGGLIGRGDKVWLTASPATGFDAQMRLAEGSHGHAYSCLGGHKADWAFALAERALGEAGFGRDATFEQIVARLEG